MRAERKYEGWSQPNLDNIKAELTSRITLIQKPTSLRSEYFDTTGKWIVIVLSDGELSVADKADLDAYMTSNGYT